MNANGEMNRNMDQFEADLKNGLAQPVTRVPPPELVERMAEEEARPPEDFALPAVDCPSQSVDPGLDETPSRSVEPSEPPARIRWRGFAASVPGNGHIRHELPCQDASSTILEPRPAVIVCDGRGSASKGLSQEGSKAAVRAFRAQLNVLEPCLAAYLDRPGLEPSQWRDLCRVLYRTLAQAKLDCAERFGLPENEFDFTAAFAVVGRLWTGCFQVGDGALVIRRKGACETVFKPQKGEFANLTTFVRWGGDGKDAFSSAVFPSAEIDGVAATSDGPEHRLFHLAGMTPGPRFDAFFDELKDGSFTREDLLDYLTAARRWSSDPRDSDDRSVALLAGVVEKEPRD